MPTTPLLLASSSAIRLTLLQNAGLTVTAQPARIDEDAIRASLQSDNAKPRDVADTLAELKARKLADKNPTALVLGCDQILAFNDQIFAKPTSPEDARQQLHTLRNHTHHLHSAIVLYHQAKPIWRHIATAKLTMRPFTDAFLDAYIQRNWPMIQHSVGSYLLESEGIRLFSAVEGDYFAILGLPLLPLLNYLSLRGFISS
ncbi:MAG: Maf family protein [Paracoccaceae bacterium]